MSEINRVGPALAWYMRTWPLISLTLVAVMAGAATADPSEPPAALIHGVARRGATVTDRIDPDAGLVVRDDRGARRVCGAAVALYGEAIDRGLRTAVDDVVTCTGSRYGRVCCVELRQPSGGGDPNLALAFTGPAPGTLAVAVWSEAGVSVADIGRALRRAAPACPAPGPAPMPAPPLPTVARPTAATRALMRALITGQRPWTDVIDDARGVTFVRYTSTEAEPPVARWSQHRCGADAVTALRAHRRDLRRWMGEEFSCANQPGPPTCVVGGQGEFEAVMRFGFRTTPAGVVLDTIATVNSVYGPLDQEPVLAALRARHLDDRCP